MQFAITISLVVKPFFWIRWYNNTIVQRLAMSFNFNNTNGCSPYLLLHALYACTASNSVHGTQLKGCKFLHGLFRALALKCHYTMHLLQCCQVPASYSVLACSKINMVYK